MRGVSLFEIITVLLSSGRRTQVPLPLYDALHVETMHVFRQANTSDISHIMLETDSLNLHKALTSEVFDSTPGSCLFREARQLLLVDFEVQAICHCNRLCNVVAHELACFSVSRFGLIPSQPLFRIF